MAHRGWVFCIPRHSAGPLERRRATAHTTLLGLLGHPVTLIRSLGHFRIPVPRDCLPWMRHYARSNTASAAYRKCYFVLWFRSIRNQARLHGVDNANTKLLRGRGRPSGTSPPVGRSRLHGSPCHQTRRGATRRRSTSSCHATLVPPQDPYNGPGGVPYVRVSFYAQRGPDAHIDDPLLQLGHGVAEIEFALACLWAVSFAGATMA